MRSDAVHSHSERGELLARALSRAENGSPANSLYRFLMTIAAILFAWVGPALAQGGEAADVRAARERVKRIEQAEGGESVGLAAALLELGVLLDSARADAEARTVLERALAIREKSLGKEHTGTATVLTRLGHVLDEQGNYAEARGALERSLAIREKLLGREHADTIASVADLGLVLFELGDLDAALALLERALASGEKAFGPRDPRVASYLAHLGRVYSALGRAQAARESEERALAIRSQVLGLEHLETAASQHELAVLLQSAGEYVRASELFQSTLSTRAKLLGPGDPDTALTELGLGSVLHAQGRFEEAEVHLGNALAVCEAQPGNPHVTTLRALDALSTLFVDRGRFREARPLLQRLYAGQQKKYPRDHPIVVATLGRLAVLFAKLGDAEAESLLVHAIAISEQTSAENPAQTAQLVEDLAELFEHEQRYVEAEPLFERALAVSEKSSGPEHPNTARALDRLASCLRAQAKNARARPMYERALAILEKTVGADHPDTSAVLHNLGALARDEGEIASARACFERALAARTRALGAEHPNTQRTRQLSIFVLADSGEREAAWTLATESIRASRGEWMRSLWSLSEDERLQSIAGRRAVLGLMLDFVPAESDSAERTAYEAVLEWKARAARSLLEDPVRVFAEYGATASAQLNELRGVHAEISTEQSRPVIEDKDAHERRLTGLRERRGALEQALNEAAAATSQTIDVDTASVMRSLPEGTALVDFFMHQGYVPAVLKGTHVMTPGRRMEPRLSAWVSKAGAEHPVRVDLGPAHAVRQSERAFLESLQTQRALSAATGVGRSAFEEASARLIELVWAPVKELIGDARQVFISPDRFLGALPFETLLQDGGTYLIEQHSFVYLVDAASLSAIARRAPRAIESASADGGLLAVGGIDYNLRGAPPAFDEDEDEDAVDEDAIAPRSFLEPWEKLRFAGREVAVAAELFTSTHPDGASVTQLRDGFATETALKREIPGRRYLHLATRGFFQRDDLSSPGRLSGLACAGANLAPDETGDDGLLTVDEITSLDLTKCDLVVLSACEPGLGTERGGDGVMPLQRAFQMQGAQTVVASLWSVDEAVTIDLVSSFYRRLWTDKQSRIDALRGAQLELLKRNRAAQQGAGLPYTWGAFVLSGDWR
jgi:CHAT domain-containing protein/tetratricopeptide (TPR) repeat protein